MKNNIKTLFCLQIHVNILVNMLIAPLFCSAAYVNGIKSDLQSNTWLTRGHTSLNQRVGVAKRLTLPLVWGIRVIYSQYNLLLVVVIAFRPLSRAVCMHATCTYNPSLIVKGNRKWQQRIPTCEVLTRWLCSCDCLVSEHGKCPSWYTPLNSV
jgi:hypothetical protein